MLRWLLCCMVVVSSCGVLFAQDGTDLVLSDLVFTTQLDAFGEAQTIVTGNIRNTSETTAYTAIQLYGDVLDADQQVIGEAFGYLVNACDIQVELPLQPQQTRRLFASLDLYEEDIVPEQVEFDIIAETTTAEISTPEPLPHGVGQVSAGEVVSLEWADADTLYFGVGCHEQVFTNLDWYQYELSSGETTAIENPNTAFVNDTFIERSAINLVSASLISGDREENPMLIQRSMLSFSPYSSRVVFQNDIHELFTAEDDGSYLRIVSKDLGPYTLRGFTWTPDDNFLAYYFGAVGDPVYYVTGTGRGTRISLGAADSTPSLIVPGVMNDARRVIIGGTFPAADGTEVTGYYLQSAISASRELLFEAETLPPNNYPAPIYKLVNQATRYLYVIRSLDDLPTLQCYHLEGDTLHTLTRVPLQLSREDRAWSLLSPDGTMLALSANGNQGGLWLIDLAAYPPCSV